MLLAGCASHADVMKESDPPDVSYAAGDKLLNSGKWSEAAAKFEAVDRDHPYSSQAGDAIVMAAYAYYKAGSYPEAISSAQRFVTLHPGAKEAALAQHIIAMSYFEQINDPTRDQSRTRAAVDALKTLVRRYPDSPYAKDAQARINATNDVLAGSEMSVGRYYMKQSNYLAAVNRFKVVVTDYQTTLHVEEALLRLVEAYMALGIKNEAQTAAAVLGHNFPDSQWYKHAYHLLQTDGLEPYEYQGSWISRAWRRVKPI
jgi:outer membrane protein assembly factor BamD